LGFIPRLELLALGFIPRLELLALGFIPRLFGTKIPKL